MFLSAWSFACTYTLELIDTWGDGWDGAEIEVYINGSYQNVYAPTGAGLNVTITANQGDNIELYYTAGSYESEHEWNLYNSSGTLVASDGPFPSTGWVLDILADCGGGGVATAGDCSSAINVCTDLGFQIDANGFGSINEIPALGSLGNPSNNNPGGSGNSGCLRIGESNSTWMIINIAGSGNLEFNFGGNSQSGYYDWIMYPYNATSCSDIPNNLVAPVRCNWNASSSGGTGLDNTPNTPGTQNAGNFEPALPVQCGEQYIICFSNYSSAVTNVPLVFGGTATVECMGSTCAGTTSCNYDPGNTAYQNCIGAIPVCQNVFCQEYAFSGVGSVTGEITPGISCLASGEKNDAWYIFTVQQSGNVNFLITPNTLTDDYDWALYNLTDANCSQIPTTASLQVSCNYSGTDGTTGPNGGSTNTSQGSGGTPYNAVVPVLAGETYVLNVSNYTSSNAGYVLDFSASTAVIFDNVPPALDLITSTQSCGSTSISIRFTEQVLCSSVQACDFTVTGPGGPYTVTGVTGPGCTGSGTQGAEFTVTISPALSSAGNFNLNLVSGCGWVEDLCGNVAVDGSLPFTIIGPTSSMTQTNVLCYGASTGTATVTVAGGSPNYTYDWSHLAPITNASASNTVTGLSATPGVYSVTVTSNGGCTTTSSVTITQAPQITIALTPSPETCSGANDGSIAITVTGGTANYNYTCTGQSNQNNKPATYTYTGLASGSYTISVTDANGCTASATTSVSAGSVVNAAFSYPGNQCFNAAGNTFTFTNTSTGATSYSWTFAGGTPATSAATNPTVTFNTAGAHNVVLTASNGAACNDVETIIVTVYDLPVLTVTPTPATCNGFCDGSITVVATGGSGVYSTYTWSPAQPNSPNASNLCAGNYAVTVKDSYNCSSTGSASVSQPAALVVSASRNDITCNGLCDGKLFSSVVSGGSGSFNYLWSNAVATQNQTGLCAGTYTVSIFDALSTATCYQTASVSINEPSAMVLTSSSVNANCGASDGSASVVVTNGMPNYTYNWTWSTGNNNSTTPSNTNTVNSLPSGAVNLTVTDGSGCSVNTVINVNANSGPTSSITSFTNVNCNGGANGSAEVTVVGGAPNYVYVWDGGAPVSTSSTTNSINTLTAGTHTVVITDANTCVTSASVTITQPTSLVASTSVVNSHCGQSDGSVTVNVSGGTAPYTYAWTVAGSTNSISSKPAGTYSVTVTDAAFCTVTASGTISDIGGITSLSTTQTPVACFGGSNGTATVTVTGGVPVFSYSWSNAQTGSTATGLSVAGSPYTVTVTDGNGCKLSTSVTMTQPTQVTASISASDSVSCFGGNDGWATVIGSGGVTPYSYQWGAGTGSQITATASNLYAGNYCVTVKDVNNCSAPSVCVIINQPPVLNANIASTVAAHCGNPDGGATVAATGGTTPYSYLWPTGSVLSTITGLTAAGSPYIVTVTDAKGCTKTASATISDLPAGTALISIQKNVSCNGLCDGELTVSASGATSPYTYSWNTTPAQNTVKATGLCAGNYCVTVIDANNCSMSVCATIIQPAVLTNTFNTSDANCYGVCDGSITANPTGGTTAYSYLWSTNATSQTVNNLCAGNYSITITDSKGCTKLDAVTITEPGPMTLAGIVTNAHCAQRDGMIDITVTNGPAPFSYIWDNGAPIEDIDSIPAGSYCVTVTNAKNCKIDSCFIIDNETGPVATISIFNNLSCYQSCDGSATVSVTGGNGAYTYTWSDGQTLATATNLCAGVYTVTVEDEEGCTSTASVTLIEPVYLNYFLTTSNPTCSSLCDGWAKVVPFGGTSPYTYQWIGGGNNLNSQQNNGLCAQNYQILITDANGCDTLGVVSLSQPSNIVLSTTFTQVKCFGNNDGTATVNASGGTPGNPLYTYEWDTNAGSQTTQTASGLYAGNYCVTVYDGNGCSNFICVTVTSPDELIVNVNNVVDVTCFGYCDGAISTSASGGVPPYFNNWSNTAQTAAINNLCFGTYLLTVTDFNGCSKQTSIIVSQPPQLNVSLVIDSVRCKDECNGSIYADVSGGTPITSANPYSYQWNDALLQQTQTAGNLCDGIYTVIVTDGNSCTKTISGHVYEPTLLQLIIENIVDAKCDSANGSATVGMLGGTTGYSIEWSNGWNGFTQDNLVAAFYGVTVSDWNGCTTDTMLFVNNENGPTIDNISKSDILCYGDTNAWITVVYSGGTGAIDIVWNTSVNDTLSTITNLGVGNYSVTLTDANNCKAIGFEQILGPQYPINSVINQKEDASCFGFCDASATVLTVGGTPFSGFPKYTYQWNIGDTDQTADNLCAGVYSVISTDSLNCKSVANVTLTEPDQILIDLVQLDNVSCANMNPPDGKITISATGGNNIFNYDWQAPVNTNNPTAGGLDAGTYTVIVSELGNAACFAMESYDIAVPEPITATLNYISPKCSPYYSNGTIFVETVNGGVAPYSYYWGGNNYGDTLNNVSSGNYSVMISDDNNCSLPFPIDIDYIHPPIIDLIDKTDITCAQSVDGSALFVVKEGTSPFQYEWTPNNGSGIISSNTDSIHLINLSPSAPLYYEIVVTDNVGCDTLTSFQIKSKQKLVVTGNGPSTTVCNGANLTISASANGGTAPYQYTWNQNLPGLTSHVVKPTDLTYYNATITDANGCADSVSIPVYVYNPITVTLDASDAAVCKGDSVDLYVNHSQGAGAPYTVTWNNNIGIYPDQSFYVVPTGPTDTYIVTVKDKCSSTASDAVTVGVNPLPKGLIESDVDYGCEPLTVKFNNAQHQTGYTYSWDFGDNLAGNLNYSHDTLPTHIFNNSGSYDINFVVYSEDNCKDIVLVENMINVFPNPNAAFDPYPDTVGAFRPTIKFFDQSTAANIQFWEWNFGDIYSGENMSTEQNPEHYYSGPGLYTIWLKVISDHQCIDSTSNVIRILDEHTFYAPTAFAPSAGGINKEWYPVGIGVDPDNYHLYIYDRWGELIFESTVYYDDLSKTGEAGKWNGKVRNKGKIVEMGVYAWYVQLKDVLGTDHEYAGTVTVIK